MVSRILLVEDEENLREAIKMNLELEGYEVEVADTGTVALKKVHEQRFNLIILDVMLPEIDGFTVCQKIRIDDTDTPILFLTAKDTSQDKVNGLKQGADDYLTKPFNLEELLLRVKVLIKHSVRGKREGEHMKQYKFGANEVNFLTFKAKGVSGTEHTLTKKEISLLKLLIDRKGTVVSRTQILQFVWGYDIYPSTRTIDNFIMTFRKYFEPDPSNPRFFHSVRGVGYKFTEEG
ncbi:MAG TPA: response regulator transcription factor [Chitinophagales bacterium]|nr:response regulator transcription factor [Chitinophagales bacterium]